MAEKTKSKYRLLVGIHYGSVGTAAVGKPGDAGYKPASEDYEKSHKYDAKEGNNNIVESSIDLVKRFGAEKFAKVDNSDKDGSKAAAKASGQPVEDGYDDMTVAELKEYAESEEVELGNKTKKDEIIAALRANDKAKLAKK